jgi:hypothetical protein
MSFILLIIPIHAINATTQDKITYSFQRGWASENGNIISGDFTITANGDNSIVRMAILFNSTPEYSVNDNILKWTFQTADYPNGEYHIQIIGWSLTNESSSIEFTKFFVERGLIGILIPIGLFIAIGVLIVIVLYNQKVKKPNKTPKKNEITVDLDPTFN